MNTYQPPNRPIALGDAPRKASPANKKQHFAPAHLSRNLKERTAAKVIELGRYTTPQLQEMASQKWTDKAVRDALAKLLSHRGA